MNSDGMEEAAMLSKKTVTLPLFNQVCEMDSKE